MPIRIHPGVGGINQRMMHATAVLRGSRAVGGGSNEWMRELHAPADLEQPSAHRRVGSSHVEAERPRGAAEQQWVAERLRSRTDHEKLGVGREQVKGRA
jgi:hypothetical protein